MQKIVIITTKKFDSLSDRNGWSDINTTDCTFKSNDFVKNMYGSMYEMAVMNKLMSDSDLRSVFLRDIEGWNLTEYDHNDIEAAVNKIREFGGLSACLTLLRDLFQDNRFKSFWSGKGVITYPRFKCRSVGEIDYYATDSLNEDYQQRRVGGETEAEAGSKRNNSHMWVNYLVECAQELKPSAEKIHLILHDKDIYCDELIFAERWTKTRSYCSDILEEIVLFQHLNGEISGLFDGDDVDLPLKFRL